MTGKLDFVSFCDKNTLNIMKPNVLSVYYTKQ